MNLLIWTQFFWPENFPVINKLAKILCDQGVRTTILTGKPNYPSGKILGGYRALGIDKEEYCGADVIRIPIIPRGSGSFIGLLSNYLSFIFSGYLLAPFALRGRKFDAVFVYATSPLLQALPAIFIAWLKGAPLIIWVQDLWPESLQATGFIRNRPILWIVNLAVQYIYAKADSILIQSEGFRSYIEPLVKNKNKIHFYPNGLEEIIDVKTGCEIAEEVVKEFSVVFTGNIGSAQSCETIIGAAAILKNNYEIKFYIMGGGSKFTSIESDIKSRGLTNVVMPGQVPYEKIPAIFAASSVLLLTLGSDPILSATIPSKLQSYLSATKPIIASANGEVAQIISNSRAGIVCPAENAEALANAVMLLYGMTEDERSQLGKNGYEYFKTHFDIQKLAKKLTLHLKSMI